MAIPGFQFLMLPLLHLAQDNGEHSLNEVVESLAKRFGLNENDRRELIPSGGQFKFDNRVGWARTYLTKAGLLETTGRSKFRITARGQAIVRNPPLEIDARYLRRFPEFQEFSRRPSGNDHPPDPRPDHEAPDDDTKQTPDEELESIYQSIRRDLAHDLLSRIRSCPPRFFEQLVVDLVVAMGYGGSRKDAGQAVGQSGDGGIDGIIKEDKLGLDVVYIQAKRWESIVGRPIVQAFAGSLEGQRARKGVLITTSQFSQDARDYVTRIEKRIVLIDGEQLAQYMIDHGIGVTEAATYTIKRVDLDYFNPG